MAKKSVRDIALEILLQIEKNQAYSNLLLNQRVKKELISERDIGLLTEIIYGTIQRRDTLDYYLTPFVKKGLNKLEQWVLVLLRLSLYQMIYLDRVPEHAILNEAVTIAKKRGHQGISGMVNGVLRSIQRSGVPSIELIKDEMDKLAIETSHPRWLIERWVKEFGYEDAKKMAEMNLIPPSVTIRVNQVKSTVEEAVKRLTDEGLIVTKGDLSQDAIKVTKGYVPSSYSFIKGFVTIQDESSMLVARALDPQPGMNVLDCCAAPGGKTTHLAERMENEGQVTGLDLHSHKVKLIKEQQDRLELSNIEAKALDARKVQEEYENESFDCILVDAPCSGLGVIRRKPDLKWTKTQNDIEGITSIQKSILQSVAPLLKKGGRIVYSTCTVDRVENEDVVNNFLSQNDEFSLDESMGERLPQEILTSKRYQPGMLTILPQDFGTDGFFISVMKKQ
ncbi:16S rRNA (cytosine(967)-C(5))-methyltransferase RsmB [Bacillus sp. FJAT-45350]|uniref:16S rRNA (cytosine(967)-C(5))-methyltransferase RsmB n=1 Tax=Bacillus sp. FJAT-45350 TaxID=2011014 RepID=UPI000BB7B57A|nr:16S rRNA (cytosine(967)-C(5))-methyltransferase RsmB [Bacillus sp. FJAT-45350]